MPSILEESQHKQRLEDLRSAGGVSPGETIETGQFEPKSDHVFSNQPNQKSFLPQNKPGYPPTQDNPKNEDRQTPKRPERMGRTDFGKISSPAKTSPSQTNPSKSSLKRPRSFGRTNRLDPRFLAQRAVKAAASPFSLVGSIDISRDFFFAFALIAAMLKDLSDITLGLIPGVGLVLAFVFGLMATTVIVVCVLVTGSFRLRSSIKKWLTIGATNLTEMLFGINFLPIETISVIILFFLTLMERKEEKAEREAAKRMDLAENAA